MLLGRQVASLCDGHEVEQMVEHSCDWVRTALVLAFYQGLRSGELRALQARDIDFDRGLVFVRRVFSENVLQDRPKDNDERVIPIAELARAQLLKAVRGLAPEDFVIRNRNGRTPTRQAVWLAFRAVQDKAGLDRRFGVHALRHGFCTELVRSNVGVETVRAGRARRPTHDPALPALRALGLGAGDRAFAK